jgi:hypothetical protein
MSSLVWSKNLKFAFKSSRNSVILDSLNKILKSDESKAMIEMKKQNELKGQDATTMGYWN